MIYSFRKKLVIIAILLLSSLSFHKSVAVTVHINSGNPAYPFPQFLEYACGGNLGTLNPEGVVHAEMEQDIRDAYQIHANEFEYTGKEYKGVKYIETPDKQAYDCTEGDGYALLAAAYMADLVTFNGVWMCTHDKRRVRTKTYAECEDNTPGYIYGPYAIGDDSKRRGNTNYNTAADGDVDVALALYVAYKQWGEFMRDVDGNIINDACGNPISLKQELINVVRGLVALSMPNEFVLGDHIDDTKKARVYSGIIGLDGYPKGGDTWGEQTTWASTNPIVESSLSIMLLPEGEMKDVSGYEIRPDQSYTKDQHIDYNAPAFYREFRDLLHKLAEEGDIPANEFEEEQFRRAEASSDWLVNELTKKNEHTVLQAGWCTVSDDGSQTTFRNFNDGEDWRCPMRQILNYVWHGNPEYTWNPKTHQVEAGGNTFEYDAGVRLSNFFKDPASWNPAEGSACIRYPGANDLPYGGPNAIYWIYEPMTGVLPGDSAGFVLNRVPGGGASAPVAAQDYEVMGLIYRTCNVVWDNKSNGSENNQGNNQGNNSGNVPFTESVPKYMHGWARHYGMMVLTGNFPAPGLMNPSANMKIYRAIKDSVTFCYTGDTLMYLLDYRNYGSVDAKNVVIVENVPKDFIVQKIYGGGKYDASSHTITWNIGDVSGYHSDGTETGCELDWSKANLKATVGQVGYSIKVGPEASGRYCTTAEITCSNGTGWVTNEYPNYKTATMQRNCVDVIKRSLIIEKYADREKINPENVATYTIDFENSSEAGWIDGGRPRVNVSFGFEPGAEGGYDELNQMKLRFRLFNDAIESYINYGNYRISYYMYDPAITCFEGEEGCERGSSWGINQEYISSGDPSSVKFSHENIVEGEGENGKKYNQRLTIQFPQCLVSYYTHLNRYKSNIYIHKGDVTPFQGTWRMFSQGYQKLNWTDDWSFDEKYYDIESNFYYPITPSRQKINKDGEVEVIPIDRWLTCGCTTSDVVVPNLLVEEYDGYVWRRILGTGPTAGRDVYNVYVRDTLPEGLEFVEFISECPLEEYNATLKNFKTDDGRTVVEWFIPKMQPTQKGSIKYNAIVTFPSGAKCMTNDETIINNAWISADKNSPVSDTARITVTCSKVPKPVKPTTMSKVADKEAYEVGDEITYTIGYKQTHGAIFNDAAKSDTDWDLKSSQNSYGNSISNGTVSITNGSEAIFEKSYSKNVFISLNISVTPGNNSRDGESFIYFRDGTKLGIWRNYEGNGELLFNCYDKTGKNIGNSKLAVSLTEFKLNISLVDDILNVWFNKDTSKLPSFSVENLEINPGHVGFVAPSNGSVKFSNINIHTDYAYDLAITDFVPAEVSVDEGSFESYHNGVSAGSGKFYKAAPGSDEQDRIEWTDLAQNPIAYGDTFTIVWKGTVESCDESIINVASAHLLGHADDEIMAQAVSECGVSCPIEKVTLTAAASEICEGDSVLLTAAAEPAGNYEYEFFLDKVSLGAPSASDELYVKKKGSYTVKVYDAADISCNKESSKVEVKVDSIPPFSLGNDISLCSGGTAWIKTGLPTGYTYEWSNGAAEDSIEVNAAGEYSVKVSSSICEAFDTIQVTVADELKVDLGPDTTVCATSLPYILDATAIYDTYEWSDASTASTLEVTQSGEYTVKVTQGSCSGEGKVTVTVSEVEKLKGTFEVTYLVSDTTANGVFANNLTAQDAGVLEKVSGIQYTWMKADGTPLLEEPTPDVPAAGSSATETYKVFGVNADGCPTDTATINVTISGAPVPVVSDTSYCVGETSQALTATPSPSSDGATWTLQWYDANKSPLAAAPTPSTDASGETTYYVSQKSGNNESGLVPVTVKVYGAATPDVSQNQLAYCMGDTYNNPIATVTANVTTLQMQGTLEWKVGATAWDGASPVDYASGDTKVSVVNKYEISASHVCVSDTASFTVSVTELAKPTGDLSVNYVKTEGASGTFPSLTDKNANVAVPSTGNQLVWYDAAGTKQTDTPTPQYDNNWAAGKDYELTYFVSQTDGTCESDTVTVKVTISDSPMPTAAPVSYCQNAPATALTASINTTVDGAEKYVLLWYTTATGGTAQDSIVPTTDLVGSTTYYVSQKHKYTNAESSRTSVVVTVHALPELGATTPDAQCGGSVDLNTLFNEKNNLSVKYDFYEDATTATALSSSAVTVGKTYYAEGYYEINATATTTAVCRSVARTPVTVTIDDLSGLAIAGDATVCPNGTVELTASATSTSPGTITYSWDGGAASATSIYTTPVITGDFGSSHNFTVEAVAGACSETATHTVKIDRGIRDGAMTINGSAGKELRICGGETIELGTTHTGSNFAWYDMSGSPIQSGATLSVTPTQTTQYELRFENQCATSDTITIEVSSFSVSVDWTALNKTICTGEEAYATLSLTGYDPTASGSYIKWYKDGSELTAFANNSSLTIPQATLSDNGTYTYKVSNGACEKPDATTVDAGTLTVLAPATYTKSADQVICAGESVLLEVTANETDAQLQWADGLTDASRSENPTQATSYQFTVNRSGYCAVTDSIVVDVRQLPVTKITDNLLVCEGDAAELVGGATGDDLSGYYWIAPSGDTIGSGLKVRITPTEGGEYQFVVNSANCGSSASKLTLTLVERPKVGIDSLGIRDRRILVLSGGSGVFEFRIDEGEWSANDTYTNIPFMQHTAWVRDEVGCQGSALFVVTAPEIAIPEFFSPEGDGVNDEWDLSHIFDVYDQAEVTIYDRFGKELITFKGDVGSWDGTYNGHPMPSTDYWYVINIPEIDMIYTGHFTLIRK